MNIEKNPESFVYTPGSREKVTKSGLLSPEQRTFYEENGFLVIPKLVEEALLDECRDRFLDIVDGRVEKGWKMDVELILTRMMMT